MFTVKTQHLHDAKFSTCFRSCFRHKFRLNCSTQVFDPRLFITATAMKNHKNRKRYMLKTQPSPLCFRSPETFKWHLADPACALCLRVFDARCLVSPCCVALLLSHTHSPPLKLCRRRGSPAGPSDAAQTTWASPRHQNKNCPSLSGRRLFPLAKPEGADYLFYHLSKGADYFHRRIQRAQTISKMGFCDLKLPADYFHPV